MDHDTSSGGIVRIPVIVSSDSGANVSMIPAQREQRYGSS
jgi:hypothetical protein